MKPHVRRGRAAKKARQNRAQARFKVKTDEGNLTQNSDSEIELIYIERNGSLEAYRG